MDDYHVYEEIGKGRTSVVYKGRKKKTIEYVAVKGVKKILREEALTQVRYMHNLHHPNILHFYAWYETNNHIWLIVEYCCGGNVREILETGNELSEESALALARGTARALDYLHTQNVICGMIQPHKVLLDEEGNAKLTDFSFASRKGEEMASPPASADQLQSATASEKAHMPPEFAAKRATLTPKTDVWSLGAFLYRACGGDPQSLLQLKNGESEYAPLPRVSPRLNDLLGSMLRSDPAQRPTLAQVCTNELFCIEPQSYNQEEEHAVHNKASEQPEGSHSMGVLSSSDMSDESPYRATAQSRTYRDTPKETRPNSAQRDDAGDLKSDNDSQSCLFPTSQDARDHDASDEDQRSAPQESRHTTSAFPRPDSADEPRYSREHLLEHSTDGQAHAQQQFDHTNISSTQRNGDKHQVPSRPGPESTGNVEAVRGRQAPSPNTSTDEQKTDDVFPPKEFDEDTSNLQINIPAIFDEADIAVRPIALNKKLDGSALPAFEPRALPVRAYTHSQIIQMQDGDFHQHILHIFNFICSKRAETDRLNALAYVLTVVAQEGGANRIVQPELLTALVETAHHRGVSAHLRVRLYTILGTALRFASHVPMSSFSSVFWDVVQGGTKDADDRVRQRALSALGEAAFYAVSFNATSKGSAAIPVPVTAIRLFCKTVIDATSLPCRLVALRTLENLSVYGSPELEELCSVDIVRHLAQSAHGSSSDMERSMSATCMSRLARLYPQRVRLAVEHMGIDAVVSLLNDRSDRVVQAMLNVLNVLLEKQSPRIASALRDGKKLISQLTQLMDRSSSVVKAKALLALASLTSTMPYFFAEVDARALLHCLDRAMRDRAQSVHAALGYMHGVLRLEIPQAVHQLHDQRAPASPATGLARSARRPGPDAKGTTGTLRTIAELLEHRGIRSACSNAETIAVFVHVLHNMGKEKGVRSETKLRLLECISSLAQDEATVKQQAATMVSDVLPLMATYLGPGDKDSRFVALRIVCDIITYLMTDPAFYLTQPSVSSTSESAAAVSAPAALAAESSERAQLVSERTRTLNHAIVRHILPSVPALIHEKHTPIPAYAIRLTSVLVTYNAAFVCVLERLGLIETFVRFLDLEHPNNNVHNLNIVQQIVECPDIPSKCLFEYGLPANAKACLHYAMESLEGKTRDAFVEPLLAIYNSMLFIALEERAVAEQAVAILAESGGLLCDIVLHAPSALARGAASVVVLLSQLFPEDLLAHVSGMLPQLYQCIHTCDSDLRLRAVLKTVAALVHVRSGDARSLAVPGGTLADLRRLAATSASPRIQELCLSILRT